MDFKMKNSSENADSKAVKAQAKAEKKLAKLKVKTAKKKPFDQGDGEKPDKTSVVVRWAEAVRGLLYLILAVSMIVAIILSNKGYIIKFEDIFDSLIAGYIGKAILGFIAAAFFIVGLKHLRAVK